MEKRIGCNLAEIRVRMGGGFISNTSVAREREIISAQRKRADIRGGRNSYTLLNSDFNFHFLLKIYLIPLSLGSITKRPLLLFQLECRNGIFVIVFKMNEFFGIYVDINVLCG